MVLISFSVFIIVFYRLCFLFLYSCFGIVLLLITFGLTFFLISKFFYLFLVKEMINCIKLLRQFIIFVRQFIILIFQLFKFSPWNSLWSSFMEVILSTFHNSAWHVNSSISSFTHTSMTCIAKLLLSSVFSFKIVNTLTKEANAITHAKPSWVVIYCCYKRKDSSN